ncbi:putative kelch-type beta propeller [Helianthus debilis subsp. tardiflorus]
MLEGPAFLVSRDLPSACEQECKWAYNALCVTGVSKEKRYLDGEETDGSKSSLTPSGNHTQMGDLVISLSEHDQSDNKNQSGQSDPTSLINHLGRDLSINCLLHSSRSDYGSIASLNRTLRSLIRGGELYRLRRLMGIVEHWVYFSCNLFEWEAFDPIRRMWMRLPTMDCNECFTCSDKESLAVGTELLVFGKEIDTHVVYKYNILTNSWSPGSKTHTPRYLFGSAILGVLAIVAGGCGPSGNILSSAELYNSETGTWVTLPDMHKPRKICSGVFMESKFYVIGGIGEESNNELTCGEVYDLETGSWTEIQNMFPALTGGQDAPATAKAPPLLAVVKNELYRSLL